MKQTHEGGSSYEHSLDHAVEFFAKAGSLFVKRQSFYGDEESALSLFQKSWIVDPLVSFKLMLWMRDPRGGAGNRSGFRACLTWLARHNPEWIKANLALIPETGRWDDLVALYDTSCEDAALSFWAHAITRAEVGDLSCKWAGRKDNRLRKAVGLPPKAYRQLLVSKTRVVENEMCANAWDKVKYQAVPSVAMSRYAKAFSRHDGPRFESFKQLVASGEQTVNATTLFPHDCVRAARHGDKVIADLQFAALPDYLDGTDRRILCLCDSSGSMGAHVSGSVEALDVSMGLSLYCSDRLPKNSPFYRKFMQFEDESRLSDWSGMKFSEVINGEQKIFNGAVGATNIQKALDGLLTFAKMFQAKPHDMPNVLLIISDMQFTHGAKRSGETEIENSLSRWREAGYDVPTIIYWNTAGYAGTPTTSIESNVAMVSGFSPALLSAVLKGDDVSPRAVMLRTLEKYQGVTDPDIH